MEAARAWAFARVGRADDTRPAAIDEQTAADFQQMGVAISADQTATANDGAFEVGKDNWDTLRAFLAVETQWRFAVVGSALLWFGLDLTAVDIVLRRYKSPDHVFDELMAMEGEALAVFEKVSREH